MESKQVRQERTGWRDQRLSERHRQWGWDCPAVDIDWLVIEYDQGKAVAIVEYKNEHRPTQYSLHPSYQALIDVGNRASLPVFAVRYADDLSWYKVKSLNKIARDILPEPTTMTEQEYVTFMYKLRGIEPPIELFRDWVLV